MVRIYCSENANIEAINCLRKLQYRSVLFDLIAVVLLVIDLLFMITSIMYTCTYYDAELNQYYEIIHPTLIKVIYTGTNGIYRQSSQKCWLQ